MRGLLKLGFYTLGAAAAVGLSTQPAAAVSIRAQDDTKGCQIAGYATVRDDTTRWQLYLVDKRADGHGVYAKIVIDRGDHADTIVESGKTDSMWDARSFSGDRKYSGTLSAKVYACVEQDDDAEHCTEVAQVDER
ncbi:MAG: hypothetical protein ABW321_06690 [Polyangiales bacterium]